MKTDVTTSQILYESNDGVLTLTAQGEISFINPCAVEMLEISSDIVGQKYADVLLQGHTGHNDLFHDFVLSAIYEDDRTHAGTIQYTLASGQRITLQIKTYRTANRGIVIILTDITELSLATQKATDSTVTFSILIATMSLYVFFYETMDFIGVDIPTWGYTWIINFIAVGVFFFMIKYTSLNWRDMGIRIENKRATFIPATILAAAGVALLVVVKLILLQVSPDYFPADAPFWDFSIWNFSDTFYLPTVVLQEFLARGAIQGMLARLFGGKRSDLLAIVAASAIFSVFHIAYGFPLMLGAALYLGLLGKLYIIQGNIWGLVIIHYFLGEAFTFLRF